jgi:hypothetical protein
MVCADKVRIIETWHFFSILSKKNDFSQPSNFLTKIFHSFEENKHYYDGILQTL